MGCSLPSSSAASSLGGHTGSFLPLRNLCPFLPVSWLSLDELDDALELFMVKRGGEEKLNRARLNVVQRQR